MFITFVTCILIASAQERTITGVVMDGEYKGEPLVGATITIKSDGLGKGTISMESIR